MKSFKEILQLNEMTEQDARAQGYEFSGAYSNDKAEMKERAKKEKANGNKAIVVNVPTSKLSRGSKAMGYSVYVLKSEKNKTDEHNERKQSKLNQLEAEKKRLLDKIKEIDSEISELKDK
jgi:hypothetical protein